MAWQDWILLVLLLLAGGMALSGLWAKRLPQAEKAVRQLALAQGGLGIVILIWGVYRFIEFITSRLGFFTIVYVLSLLLAIALGLLLGYKLIRKPASAAGAAEAGDRVQAKLSKNQIALGLGGIAAAVVLFLVAIGGSSSYSGPSPMPAPTPQITPAPAPAPTPAPAPAPAPAPQPIPIPIPIPQPQPQQN